MNREEAKIILPFVTALAEGRQVQTLDFNEGDWTDIDEITVDYYLSHPLEYRIKPEPHYRPFKDGAECWETVQKEGFDWVKIKGDPTNLSVGIAVVNECDMFLSGAYSEKGIGYEEAFEKLTFVDGTPFGMKEDE